MSTIGRSHFTPDQLRVIREAIHGPGDIFKSEPPTQEAGQDVIILAPNEDIFQSSGGDLNEVLAKKGVSVKDDLDELGVTARLDDETIATLQEDGFLVYDNSPRALWPGLPRQSAQATQNTGDFSMPEVKPVEWLGADKLHAAGVTGAGQTVAVLDSGFDHPSFDLAAWKDVVDDSPVPTDRVGHGTHVAHDVLQTAPAANIVAVKVMGDDGSGRPSDIIRGIQWVIEQKRAGNLDVDIINMSLGGPPDGFPDMLDPVNRAVAAADREGITVIAAAGNSGPQGRTIGSPADAPMALAVGAALNPTTVSDFSSRGPTDDGLVKPNVMAPGEFISAWSVPGSEMEQTAQAVEALREMSGEELRMLLAMNPEMAMALGLPEDLSDFSDEEVEDLIKPNLPGVYIPEEGLVAAPGTSFAAPLVAGVAAGLEQVRDLTPEETRELLAATADSMGEFAPIEQGAGFVDAERALEQIQA